jgi:hypothetical protein
LLRNNIPDTVFVALGGDDTKRSTKLKARNKAEREANTDHRPGVRSGNRQR